MKQLILSIGLLLLIGFGYTYNLANKLKESQNEIVQLKTVSQQNAESIKRITRAKEVEAQTIQHLQEQQSKASSEFARAIKRMGSLSIESKKFIDERLPDDVIGLLNSTTSD